MLDLHSSCSEKRDCVLTISGDQYHGWRSEKALEMYSALPFYSGMWLTRKIEDDNLLDEGMAQRNGIGRRENKNISTAISDYDYDSSSLYIGDMVYINAKGDVLLDCDLSYVNQKKYAIGNVMAEPLEKILCRNLKTKAA